MNDTRQARLNEKGINIFYLVIASSLVFFALNVFFYEVREKIDYFDMLANGILLLTTFYLIYVTQKNSTNKSGFYYYTSIGFAFLYFGLFILALDNVFIYQEKAANISVKFLFVSGYSLLAIGVTKWIKYNESRKDELSRQANTDVLTGILNRRSFTDSIDFQFRHAKIKSEPFSLIILDIDFFKAVNDKYGHLIGDEVLKHLSSLLKKSFHIEDKVCRWGGEEFAVLLPKTSLNNAIKVAEMIRKNVENYPYKSNEHTINYTVSLGVSEWLTSDKDVDSLIQRADTALYQAKENNRNCVKSIRA